MSSPKKVPSHIGIIMDGNGRWAETKGLPRVEGHRKGSARAKEIIDVALNAGIGCLTLYAFSMENWSRPRDEVSTLMKLLESYLRRELGEFQRQGIRYRAIGEIWKLPEGIQALIKESEALTAHNTAMTVVSALSYGGRDEILRAVREAIKRGMRPEEVTEESFSDLMDTAGLPPVDLIIRTSGEMRTSNFLLWQSAYTEYYFTETLWPDFTPEEFRHALENFQSRQRRFGNVTAREG